MPCIGYDRATEIAQRAYLTGQTVPEVTLELEVLPEEELEAALELRGQTDGGVHQK